MNKSIDCPRGISNVLVSLPLMLRSGVPRVLLGPREFPLSSWMYCSRPKPLNPPYAVYGRALAAVTSGAMLRPHGNGNDPANVTRWRSSYAVGPHSLSRK